MNDLETKMNELEQRMNRLEKSDRYAVQKLIQMFDGRNIQVGISTGTKIGTATTQKLSVYGVTPIAQQSAISAPTGGITIDTAARTAIGSIITALKNFGITA